MGFEAERADVREDIESTLRTNGADALNLGEALEHVLAADVEFLAHVGYALLVAGEGGKRTVLGERAGVRGHVALHGIDRAGDRLGSGEVAEAPTGHGVGFAESVDGDGEVVGFGGDRGDAHMLGAVVGEFLVDFIGEDVDVLLGGDFGEGLEFLAGVDRSGRVARRIDDDHLRAGRHGVFEILGSDLPVVLLAGLDENRLAADDANHLGIAEPIGGGDNDFVTLVDDGGDGIEAGLLGAIAHDDLAGFVIEAVVFKKLLGNRLAEFGNAGAGGVFGAALLERLDRGGLDVLGGVHVRLAGSETENFDALGEHGFGLAVDGEGEGGSELLESGRGFHGVI